VSKAPASGRLLGWPQVQLKLCGEEWTCPAAQPSCCWESRQPRGKLYLHLQAASDLTAESFFAVAKVGKQKRRSETAKGAWKGGETISFYVDDSEQSLRLDVFSAGSLWRRALGFVDIKVKSIQPGSWRSRSERLWGADAGVLQFEVRYEPTATLNQRNAHDFFVFDYSQKLVVNLRGLGSWGLPTTLASSQPRLASDLAGSPGTLQMSLYTDEEKAKASESVTLHVDWLEIVSDPVMDSCDNCLIECHIDEVFAPGSYKLDSLAVLARVGDVERRTALTQRKEGKSPSESQEHEFEVETILRLPVTHVAVETDSLEISAVNRRGQVFASYWLSLRSLMKQKCSFVQSNLKLEGPNMTLHTQVSVSLKGLRSTKLSRSEADTNASPDAGSPLTHFPSQTSAFQLDWINQVYRKLHPKIMTIVARQMEDPFGAFTQSLRLKMPLPLKDIHFSHFLLGTTPPEFGPFEVSEWLSPRDGAMGVELQVGFFLDTEANIELKVRGATLGVNRIRLKGDLLIRLEPLIEELPVVGGVVVCFLNQPDLEFHYTGLAQRVDATVLRARLQRLINSAVASSLVLPHVIAVPIGTEEQNVDRALLGDPEPVGVLRVWALRAAGLPSSWPLGSRSRSPYMSLSLAGEEWQSSVVFHSTSPEWDEMHEFLVFDKRQELAIEVVDTNSLFLRTVIGAAQPLAVSSAESQSERPIKLFECNDDEESMSSAPAGTAYLRFEWLNFVRPGRRGPDARSLLRVKFDEVCVPADLLDVQKASVLDPICLQMIAKVGQMDKRTPAVAWFPSCQHDEAHAASDLSVGPTIEADIEHTLFLLINAVDLEVGVLELELLDGKEKSLGNAHINLSDVAVAGQLAWNEQKPHTRLQLCRGTGKPCLLDVEVSVQGLRSARECASPG
ncbi:unnamed protein product, partial [Effrenium voratum]